jgi:predicted dehydrogenase
MIRIGVIGYGYWGPNLVCNFGEIPGSSVVTVSDLRPDRLALAKSRYPAIEVTQDPEEVFKNSCIDAIVIATPVSSHFDLALQALQSGKHVLVEKSIAATSEQAERLIHEADRRGLVLMVDHTFVYTGAVRKMRELIQGGSVGDVYYYDSVRVNLGFFQPDVNVIWDLAVHDLSIMDFVLSVRPVAVSACGMSHIPGQPEDVAYLTLFFTNRQIAHLHVNWLSPIKVRRTLIGGSEKMLVYDDLEPSEKIKIYDKGVTLNHPPETKNEPLVSYRSGDMWAPRLDTTEALRTEALHFVDCIEHNQRPETDGYAGLRIVRILEAAERSLHARGQPVELSITQVTA